MTHTDAKPLGNHNTVKPKQIARWVLVVGGALGIFKTIFEYVHTAIESDDLILGTLYYIGEVMITFVPIYIVTLVLIWTFPLGIAVTIWKKKEQCIFNIFAILNLPVAVVFTYHDFFVELQKPPDSYVNFWGLMCLSIGAVVVFTLCILAWTSIKLSQTEKA